MTGRFYCTPLWPEGAYFYGPDWAAKYKMPPWNTPGHCHYCAICDCCREWLEDPEVYSTYRPDYLEEGNRVDQRYIAARMVRFLGWDPPVEMPERHHFDFKLYRDGILAAFLEAKRRHYPFTKFEDWMITQAQADRCISDASRNGVTFLYANRFNDGLLYAELFTPADGVAKMRKYIGGRYDRGYKDANKPHYGIPRSLFLFVE